MSKRLQVLVSDSEFELLRARADSDRVSVGEWVRRSIRRSCQEADVRPAEVKLAAIRKALEYSFPTGDIDQLNKEIEEGRSAGLP